MAVDAFTAFKSGNPATMTQRDSPADAEMRQRAVNFLARIQIIADEAMELITKTTLSTSKIKYDPVTKEAIIKYIYLDNVINNWRYDNERKMILIYNTAPQLNSAIDMAINDTKLVTITLKEAQNNAIKAATNTQILLNNAIKQTEYAIESVKITYDNAVIFENINKIQGLAGSVKTLQNEIQTIITNLQNLRGTIPVPIF
jgi:hypothetical protein